MKALVVDDNATDRFLLKTVIEAHGWQVAEARDGREGLDQARSFRPSIIISDALMPRMDGFQFLRELKRDAMLCAIPFLFYSANYTGRREVDLAMSLGAEQYIVKPTPLDKLWAEIAGTAERASAACGSARADAAVSDEREYLEQYSGIVTAKLEEKIVELEQEVAKRRQAEERLQALSWGLIDRLEQERRHLARELHDEIGQLLTAIKLTLQALDRPAPGSRGAHLLEEGLASVDRAIQSVRSLSLSLRPSMLDDLGLPAALRWLADRTGSAAGITVRYRGDDFPERLPAAIENACFRIAQEALNNAVRHAAATEAVIELRRRIGRLDLSIADNGVAFDVPVALARAAKGGSFGLLGMRERAALTGGSVEIASRKGQGTEVRASFPLP